MFYSYLKIACRHLMKARTNTAINILGLSLGMAVALLAGLWVWDELSFNHIHSNHERLAQTLSVSHFNGSIGAEANSSVPLAKTPRSESTRRASATSARHHFSS